MSSVFESMVKTFTIGDLVVENSSGGDISRLKRIRVNDLEAHVDANPRGLHENSVSHRGRYTERINEGESGIVRRFNSHFERGTETSYVPDDLSFDRDSQEVNQMMNWMIK